MLEEVKKYRKGIRKDLDFLDTKKSKSKGPGISKRFVLLCLFLIWKGLLFIRK